MEFMAGKISDGALLLIVAKCVLTEPSFMFFYCITFRNLMQRETSISELTSEVYSSALESE